MKKRILFTLLSLNVGGVEKALLSLINNLDKEKYEIHIALLRPEGGRMEEVPDHVRLHTIGGFCHNLALVMQPKKEITRLLLTGRWATGLPAAYHYAKAQLDRSLISYCRWLLRGDRPGGRHADDELDAPFDLAVDFAGPPGEYLEYYASAHVNARHRCAWIHFDIDRVSMRPKTSEAVYARVDKVFCVSEKALAKFRERFPAFAGKGEVFHNLIDAKSIARLGNQPSAYAPSPEALNIVTVGRIAHVKGQDIALRSLQLLRRKGIRAFWHFVGDGPQMEEYRRLADRLGVADICRFYGSTLNPYPFMRGCDLYVQPSRHEGFCITLGEAKLFGVPILAADFTGASEQLAHLPNALIIAPFDDSPSDSGRLADAIVEAMGLKAVAPLCSPGPERNRELDSFLSLLD